MRDVDIAPFYYLAIDEKDFITDVNDSLCADLGYLKDEIVGKKAELIFTLSTRIFYQTHFAPLLTLQAAVSEIFISLLAKDQRHIPVLCNAKRDAVTGQSYFAGIFVENRKIFETELIKARNLAETALSENSVIKAAKEELEAAMNQSEFQLRLLHSQNDELKQFNHALSHQLHEPLRKLSIYGDLLKDIEGTITAKEKSYIESLLNAATQMRSVVSALQRFAWLTDNAAVFRNSDLCEIINKAGDRLRKEHPGVDLQIQNEGIPPVQVDEKQIDELFYEVLSNCIRFRRNDHVAVFISSHIQQMNSFRKTPDKYKYEEYVKIEVRDEGIGFDPRFNENIFNLFTRLHPCSGAGAGLSMARKIAENHYGRILANSTTDRGTIITLILPLRQPVT